MSDVMNTVTSVEVGPVFDECQLECKLQLNKLTLVSLERTNFQPNNSFLLPVFYPPILLSLKAVIS